MAGLGEHAEGRGITRGVGPGWVQVVGCCSNHGASGTPWAY